MNYFEISDKGDFLRPGEIGNLIPKKNKKIQLINIMKESDDLGPVLKYSNDVYDALSWFLGSPKPLIHFDKLMKLSGELYPSIHSVIENNELQSRFIIKDIRDGNHYSILKSISEDTAKNQIYRIIEQIGQFGYVPQNNMEWLTVKVPDTSLPVILKNANYFPLFLKKNTKTVNMFCGICKDHPTSNYKRLFSHSKEKAQEKFGMSFQYPEQKTDIKKQYYFPKDIFVRGDGEFAEFLYTENPSETLTSIYQVLRTLQLNTMLDCLNSFCLTKFLARFLGISDKTVENYVYRKPIEERAQEKLKKYFSKTINRCY